MRKITILTATLNSDATIAGCIESVRKQNEFVEHILLDGGSSDKTLKIVANYVNNDTKLISCPNSSLYAALNTGLKTASGDIIGILNADDIYYKNDVLTKVIRAFKNTNCDSCYGDLLYYDPKKNNRITRYWKAGNYHKNIFNSGWMPPHPSFFTRKKIYDRFGTFRNDLGTSADYELMLRLLHIHKISITYIPEILVKMKTGGISNISLGSRIKANMMDRKAWKVNGLTPYPWTLFCKPLRKISQWFRKPSIY